MSKYNVTLKPPTADTTNLAGGDAYTQSPKLRLASLVLTSFVTDQYYRSGDQGADELRTLLGEIDPRFAAKTAIFARNEYGMRSVSHIVAGELVHSVKGESWVKNFIEAVVRRPDDMTEIVAYYLNRYSKPLPNSLKKGLAAAFGKFDTYQLAKYRADGKAVSLVDLVNLVHPVPTQKNAEALKALVDDTLRSTETWEAKVSEAGKAEDAEEAKAEAWADLIKTRKIGYFALLRNLRNITQQAPELVPDACELLQDENLIRNSLVLPFRYLTALQHTDDRAITSALSKALDISLANVPSFEGKSLVVVDHSGSMWSPVARGTLRCQHVGDVFGATMYKANDSDVMVFGDTAGLVQGLNPDDSTLTLAERIGSVSHGHSTNFHAIFDQADTAYDRVFIFSDMQAWVPGMYFQTDPRESFKAYRARTGADPFVYAFDLAGYGSMQFPENKVFTLAGYSEKIFDIVKVLESDRDALLNRIEQVKL